MKRYSIFFTGSIEVEADDEDGAIEEAWRLIGPSLGVVIENVDEV